MPQNDPHKSLVANSKMDVTEIESYRRVFFDLGEFEKEQMGKSGAPEDRILSVVPRIYAGGYNTDEVNCLKEVPRIKVVRKIDLCCRIGGVSSSC